MRQLQCINVGCRFYRVGDKGTFFGGLPSEEGTQATGEILRITEGVNYAIVVVKQADGTNKCLKR